MNVVYDCCAGLDVHKKLIVACLRWIDESGQAQSEVRTYGTMTDDLLALSDWLTGEGCTQVAMESTGVYWKPVYNILEGQMEILVVNVQHMKTVPGRKTDVQDAAWIAELLQHGLLTASFIPPRFQREWRDLTRYRTSLVRERTRLVNRLQKILEDANIKLAGVATDVLGVSARQMLEALVGGETDSQALAELARGRLRKKIPQLRAALRGHFQSHHRFLIAEQLAHIDFLDEAIAHLNREIRERLAPFEEELQLLDTIPGIDRRIAEDLLAEIGPDLERFPDGGHLASWAGLCPGHNESAGKRRSGKTRKGSPWLRSTAIEAAHGAARKKNVYLSAQYHHLAGRRGKKKALVAVGHSILVMVYYILKRRQPYSDLGANYFDQRQQDLIQRKCVHRLEKLGFKVTLEPAALAA